MAPQQPKTIQGILTKVPCPYCGKPNNCKEELDLGMLDEGTEYECDHCQNIVRVAAVTSVTIVKVFQSPRNAMIRQRRGR